MEDGWDPISKYGLFSVFGENTLVIVLAVLCIMFRLSYGGFGIPFQNMVNFPSLGRIHS